MESQTQIGVKWGISSRRVHSPPTGEHTLVLEDRRGSAEFCVASNKIFCRPDASVLCRRDDVGHFCGDLSNLLSRRVVGINAVKPKSGRVHSSDYNNIVNRQLCQANIVWEKV